MKKKLCIFILVMVMSLFSTVNVFALTEEERISMSKEWKEIESQFRENEKNPNGYVELNFIMENQCPAELTYTVINTETREQYDTKLNRKDTGDGYTYFQKLNLPQGNYQIVSILSNDGYDGINYADTATGDLSFSVGKEAVAVSVMVTIDSVVYYNIDKGQTVAAQPTQYGQKYTVEIQTSDEIRTTANMSEYWGTETGEDGSLIYSEETSEEESSTTAEEKKSESKHGMLILYILGGAIIILIVGFMYLRRRQKKMDE